jgi:hypothetical protein
MDAPGNDGNVSKPEQVKRPIPWMMMIMIMMIVKGYKRRSVPGMKPVTFRMLMLMFIPTPLQIVGILIRVW